VRKALTWLAGLAGIAALLRRHRRQAPPAPANVEPQPDPAEELRRKLDEARKPAPAATSAEEESAESLDERRARIHERAQDAISLMRSPDSDPPDPAEPDR
jgi:hypothetical protein